MHGSFVVRGIQFFENQRGVIKSATFVANKRDAVTEQRSPELVEGRSVSKCEHL